VFIYLILKVMLLIGASIFISIYDDFRFFIIATLSMIIPVIFLLLTQEDIEVLRIIRLSVSDA
jgi:hypothetical protein